MRAREQILAGFVPFNGEDGSYVASEHVDELALLIPDARRAVVAASGEGAAVGRPGERGHVLELLPEVRAVRHDHIRDVQLALRLRPLELVHVLEPPESAYAVRGARGHSPLPRVPYTHEDLSLVTRQVQQLDVPLIPKEER